MDIVMFGGVRGLRSVYSYLGSGKNSSSPIFIYTTQKCQNALNSSTNLE